MQQRLNRDRAGGLVLIAAGALCCAYAISTMRLGTVASMGPGMFPAVLGALLALIGVLVVVQAEPKAAERPEVKVGPIMVVLAGIVAFALILGNFGMVPAVIMLVLITSRADGTLSLPKAIILGVFMAAIIFLIFKVAMDLPVPAFNWPRWAAL